MGPQALQDTLSETAARLCEGDLLRQIHGRKSIGIPQSLVKLLSLVQTLKLEGPWRQANHRSVGIPTSNDRMAQDAPLK